MKRFYFVVKVNESQAGNGFSPSGLFLNWENVTTIDFSTTYLAGATTLGITTLSLMTHRI